MIIEYSRNSIQFGYLLFIWYKWWIVIAVWHCKRSVEACPGPCIVLRLVTITTRVTVFHHVLYNIVKGPRLEVVQRRMFSYKAYRRPIIYSNFIFIKNWFQKWQKEFGVFRKFMASLSLFHASKIQEFPLRAILFLTKAYQYSECSPTAHSNLRNSLKCLQVGIK